MLGPLADRIPALGWARSGVDKIWPIWAKILADKNRPIGRIRDLASKGNFRGPSSSYNFAKNTNSLRARMEWHAVGIVGPAPIARAAVFGGGEEEEEDEMLQAEEKEMLQEQERRVRGLEDKYHAARYSFASAAPSGAYIQRRGFSDAHLGRPGSGGEREGGRRACLRELAANTLIILRRFSAILIRGSCGQRHAYPPAQFCTSARHQEEEEVEDARALEDAIAPIASGGGECVELHDACPATSNFPGNPTRIPADSIQDPYLCQIFPPGISNRSPGKLCITKDTILMPFLGTWRVRLQNHGSPWRPQDSPGKLNPHQRHGNYHSEYYCFLFPGNPRRNRYVVAEYILDWKRCPTSQYRI
ncbi:hypothetical protein DFH09DRAFT_1098818 [Mycena vulgaris]|nr:hypothetical protein DFH09DRAFT_1098818 [Mycena vulgaris]